MNNAKITATLTPLKITGKLGTTIPTHTESNAISCMIITTILSDTFITGLVDATIN